MKNCIKIGSVEMPLTDFVVSRNAILGITKSGKTFTAKGIAEQLLEQGVPIIVFDAIGVWRYLKVPAKHAGGKGFKVVVAGGSHPDLPLTPHSAPEIVRAAIRENIPLVIDLYDAKLSKADWRRIVQYCFHILLYENKGLRHVFLEESAEYAPQKVQDGQVYAEVEKLARMGGNASLGITLINQRAQELNKAVLELCDNIILLRQRGTHAIDSLEKQMDKLDPDSAVEIAKSMPHMTQGDCWIFTENAEKPVRTRSGLIKSFHPDRRNPDEKQVPAAAVNTDEFVSALSGKLEKVIEEAKANDPTALKIQNRKLFLENEKLQEQLTAKTPSAPGKVEIKEVPVISHNDRLLIERAIELFGSIQKQIGEFNSGAQKIIDPLNRLETRASEKFLTFVKNNAVIDCGEHPKSLTAIRPHGGSPQGVRRPAQAKTSLVRRESDQRDADRLGKCERAILTALAQYSEGRTAVQVALLTEYSVNSGGFNNSLGKLRSLGFITREQPIRITDAGLSALGDFTPLSTGIELAEHWISKLGKCEAAILKFLVDNHPNTFTSQEVGDAAGYSPNSGGFNNSLGRLRTLELITRGQPMKATDEFFQ